MPDLARIDEVVDAVVAKIAAAWNSSSPDAVEAADEIEFQTDAQHPDCIKGRQVRVRADSYDNPEPAARGYDWNQYTVEICVARLFRTADADGLSLKEWVRAERRWVEQNVYGLLTNPRSTPLLPDSSSGGLVPWAPSGVEEPCDEDELRDRRLFLSVVRVTFREDAAA